MKMIMRSFAAPFLGKGKDQGPVGMSADVGSILLKLEGMVYPQE
jgi:hypothetical protein